MVRASIFHLRKMGRVAFARAPFSESERVMTNHSPNFFYLYTFEVDDNDVFVGSRRSQDSRQDHKTTISVERVTDLKLHTTTVAIVADDF